MQQRDQRAPRSAPIAAGLMRGDFFMYFDEPEICLRIRRLGWK